MTTFSVRWQRWLGALTPSFDSSRQILAALPVEFFVSATSICADYVGARAAFRQCYRGGGVEPPEKLRDRTLLVFKIKDTPELT